MRVVCTMAGVRCRGLIDRSLISFFSFSVAVTEGALTKLEFSSEGNKMKRANTGIQQLMAFLHGYSVPRTVHFISVTENSLPLCTCGFFPACTSGATNKMFSQSTTIWRLAFGTTLRSCLQL